MNVLLIPAHQMIPNERGEVDARGFIAEVTGLSSDTMEVKMQAQNGETVTVSLQWVAAGLYKWDTRDYAVWKPFNPARGEST